MLALVFKVFVEPFEEISFNDGLIEFFLESDQLLFKFIILSDKFFEFVLIDVEVVSTFEIENLLFKLMIFLAQVLNGIIDGFQIIGRRTLVRTFSIV